MTNKPTELVVTQAQREAALEGRVHDCPYNHPIGTRCPNCANWPFKKGGAAAFIEQVRENHRLASTAPASEDEVEIVAQAIEPETFLLPRINLNKPVYDRAYKRARAAIAALRPRSEWEEIVAWLRDMPPDYEYARVFATMIENTYTKDKDKKSTLHTAAVEERVWIANWLREDAPQWGHEALADAIERGDFKGGALK